MAEFTNTIQRYILASEGGYVDHPKDPGGATNMGITHKTLAAWRGKPVSKQDVKNLSKEEALRIYEAQYWKAVGGDKLPAGLDYAVADYGINSGPARAVKDLQRVLGVASDGVIGVQTLAALKGRSTVNLIEDLCERRLKFVQGLSTYATFGKGWKARIDGVRTKSTAMAMGVETNSIPTVSEGKAEPQKSSIMDIAKDPGAISGALAALASLFGAIADQPILQVGALLLIGVLLWRFVLVRKAEDPT